MRAIMWVLSTITLPFVVLGNMGRLFGLIGMCSIMLLWGLGYLLIRQVEKILKYEGRLIDPCDCASAGIIEEVSVPCPPIDYTATIGSGKVAVIRAKPPAFVTREQRERVIGRYVHDRQL